MPGQFDADQMGIRRAVVVGLDPPHRLVHTHFDPRATIRWELERSGDGCLLLLLQTTDDVDAAIEEHHPVGLHTSLDRLGPALDGTPVPWDWDRFAVLQEEYARRLTP